jgi:type II restriction enzyme
LIRLTASNLVRAISNLPKNIAYNYVSESNSSRIQIVSIEGPEGPLRIKAYDPNKGQSFNSVKTKSLSSAMLWRAANALSTRQPINLDQLFHGSGNTRSILEALLALTPEFSMCRPKRLEKYGDTTKSKDGTKHIWWLPDQLHKSGFINWIETEIVISELQASQVSYSNVDLSAIDQLEHGPIARSVPLGIQRRHAQIQIALISIGKALNFKTSVAIQDQAISYEGKRLLEMDGVVRHLGDLTQITAFPAAITKIRDVDVVWFKNGTLMPAALEIEHTTGIKSGLDRLRGLQDVLPPYPVRYVIVADDSERERVVSFANEERFRSLNVRYFSYSSVEELYSLCNRRQLKGVTEAFLDSFMELVLV